MEQYQNAREATLEHPWLSRAWKTKAWCDLPGHMAYVGQCMYGLKTPDEWGVIVPSKKPTCFWTTKKSLADGLAKWCSGDHQHQPLEGHAPGYGSRTKMAENYSRMLAKRVANLMAVAPVLDDVMVGEDAEELKDKKDVIKADDEQADAQRREDESIKKNRRLRAEVGPQAFNYVKRLHKNLGHPAPDVLCQMLNEVQATDTVLKAAKNYLCPSCVARTKPGGVPPASGLTAKEFDDRIVVDSAWINTDTSRKCVLTILAWIKQFGVPRFLRTDEAKGWASRMLRDWASDKNIALEIAPAEAHNWLGAVERKHQVIRRALSCSWRTLTTRRRKGCYLPRSIFRAR